MPILRDLDRLSLASFAISSHPLVMGVVQETLEELWVQGVEYVEEVLSGWPLALWVLIREVSHQEVILSELGPEVLDGEFVVVGHLDV